MTLVPSATVIAAKRAFLRTTAQAYATAIPVGGVSVAVLQQFAADPSSFAYIAIAAALSPPLSGLAAYLNIIGSGIPEDYQVGGRVAEGESE